MKYYVESGPNNKQVKQLIEKNRNLVNVCCMRVIICGDFPEDACVKADVFLREEYNTENICFIYGPLFVVNEKGFFNQEIILPEFCYFLDIMSDLQREIYGLED